jgi:iron complex outermembrane receptor protein
MTISVLCKSSVSALALVVAGLPTIVLAAEGPTDMEDTIIVTGTRDAGVKARDSSTPIQVVNPEALEATGQNNVFDALKDILPSFSASAENLDVGALIRTARLRGLSPGEVLVLVNGKRRHTSAVVVADQSPDIAANPVDLDMIPTSMIDHIEVLEDGAAAQYGSDAVAGVINIILKNSATERSLNASAGITTRGDGMQGAGGANAGYRLGNDGFIDLDVDYRHHDFENRTGLNVLSNSNGITGAPIAAVRGRIIGSGLTDLVTGGFNAEKPLSENITLYAFGTAGWRYADAYENQRLGKVLPQIWPEGFFPREDVNEVDGAITVGLKGANLGGWSWDLSTTYGRDSADLGVIHTANTGLFDASGYTPTDVHAGNETTSQLTTNLDFRRPFETGLWAAPINVAIGMEHRYETYAIAAGDPASYVDGGTQGYAGFTPSDSHPASRNVEAGYIDLSTKPLPRWTIGLAGRFEHYDQTGSTQDGRLTTRYEFAPELAIRANLSNGFHAPTLAQSNFSATNIVPQASGVGQEYFLQIPLTSPGAKALGAQSLTPEQSKDISVGVVSEFIPKLHASLDAYQIFLDHRIINSGAMSGPLALQAAAANGLSVPAGSVSFVQFFNNGVDTRTRGVDFSADYKQDYGALGLMRYTVGANYNETVITNQYAIPAPIIAGLQAAGSAPTYLTPDVLNDLTKATPETHLTASATWSKGDFDVTLRESRYSHADENASENGFEVPYSQFQIKSAFITDLNVAYHLTDGIQISIGGNNIFDVMPNQTPANLRIGRQVEIYPIYTPWGLDGAYFYSRISASF